MYYLRNAPVYMMWFVIAIAAVVVTALFFVWVLALIVGIFGLFAVCWAIGMQFTIKHGDKVVGHLRWFTYTPVNPSC
jgi:hypothetical protein